MGKLVERYWEPRFEGMRRADRLGGHYRAFVPDLLCGWEFEIPAQLAGNIAEVEVTIRSLNTSGARNPEGLAVFLLRAESVGSSWIEGLNVAPRRLATAVAALERDVDTGDRLAAEVAANVVAMEVAMKSAGRGDRFDLADLLEVHQTLMRHSPRPELGGLIRKDQNWIGGSEYTPIGSRFVPPPPEYVPALLEDLIEYVNSDTHQPLLQAALAHAQFEMIHPFGDGNGRAGRALIHVVPARRGLAPRFVPPVSVVLARRSEQYIAALQKCAHVGPPNAAHRQVATVEWLRLFDTAMAHACDRALVYCDQVSELQNEWRDQLGAVRANSGMDRLLRALPGAPVLTVESASRHIGVSPDRVGPAINTLVGAGILTQRNVGRRRYRLFEAPAVLTLWMAADAASTTTAPPTSTMPSPRTDH